MVNGSAQQCRFEMHTSSPMTPNAWKGNALPYTRIHVRNFDLRILWSCAKFSWG